MELAVKYSKRSHVPNTSSVNNNDVIQFTKACDLTGSHLLRTQVLDLQPGTDKREVIKLKSGFS